jgi:hypothetical protein
MSSLVGQTEAPGGHPASERDQGRNDMRVVAGNGQAAGTHRSVAAGKLPAELSDISEQCHQAHPAFRLSKVLL